MLHWWLGSHFLVDFFCVTNKEKKWSEPAIKLALIFPSHVSTADVRGAPTSQLHVTDKDTADRLVACKNIQVATERSLKPGQHSDWLWNTRGFVLEKNHWLILHSTVPLQPGPAWHATAAGVTPCKGQTQLDPSWPRCIENQLDSPRFRVGWVHMGGRLYLSESKEGF